MDAHSKRPKTECPKTKRLKTKLPRDKTSQGQNVPRDKASQRQNVPRTKRPKGQNVLKGANEAHNLTCVANYLIQYGQDKGMA